MMKLGENVINWYSWIENRLPVENVLIYLFDKFNYLCRNNCLGYRWRIAMVVVELHDD